MKTIKTEDFETLPTHKSRSGKAAARILNPKPSLFPLKFSVKEYHVYGSWVIFPEMFWWLHNQNNSNKKIDHRQDKDYTLITFVQLEVLSRAIRQENEIKASKSEGRGEIVSFCKWHDIICMKP